MAAELRKAAGSDLTQFRKVLEGLRPGEVAPVVNASDGSKFTALHRAAGSGNAEGHEIASLLLTHRVDVNASGSQGETPLDTACSWDLKFRKSASSAEASSCRGVAELLRSHGGLRQRASTNWPAYAKLERQFSAQTAHPDARDDIHTHACAAPSAVPSPAWSSHFEGVAATTPPRPSMAPHFAPQSGGERTIARIWWTRNGCAAPVLVVQCRNAKNNMFQHAKQLANNFVGPTQVVVLDARSVGIADPNMYAMACESSAFRGVGVGSNKEQMERAAHLSVALTAAMQEGNSEVIPGGFLGELAEDAAKAWSAYTNTEQGRSSSCHAAIAGYRGQLSNLRSQGPAANSVTHPTRVPLNAETVPHAAKRQPRAMPMRSARSRSRSEGARRSIEEMVVHVDEINYTQENCGCFFKDGRPIRELLEQLDRGDWDPIIDTRFLQIECILGEECRSGVVKLLANDNRRLKRLKDHQQRLRSCPSSSHRQVMVRVHISRVESLPGPFKRYIKRLHPQNGGNDIRVRGPPRNWT
mmetsp:Transcript_82275/g.266353  ORF Transcript_82275/g.266353 Transcript_82275/m.266353 type:complete len:527 (-) Transcript_82275:304-1884(-)|eukprot:CAMPEP_0203922928 /NCGR_PEP_ID=MMETSP0359-20131031/62894_1 /ASSEMBLY_ACC=CAM_ASM_000338 /TAXON_ID=268821 /ORGANISM="Scrippsiella Hangoei, Strain SHTV-5" /LENGTH=526 /DNA_ID=CAMNT_0050850913 /DNA_START=148 /DNA_END=1728 /DNA_ORIENTATION=-